MQNTATNFSSLNKSYGLPTSPQDYGAGKAYGTHPSKALGGDATLSGWLSNATDYYNSVMKGETPKPDLQKWNQFMGWLQWAKGEAFSGGSQWDPNHQVGPGGGQDTQQPETNDFGGERGPKGTWTYDMTTTKIGFTGDKSRNDIFGSDNELNLDQPSAKVTCEETTDHGVAVLKVLVTTSKGTAVYYYDNYKDPDFKLTINAAKIDNVTGADKFAGKITVAKFDPKANAPDADPESSIPGVAADKNNPDNLTYKPDYEGTTIEFHSKPGKNQTHTVFANANISAKPGDTALVSINVNNELMITITHDDKTTDAYIIKPGYKANLNINKEYITYWDWNSSGEKKPVDGKLPDEFKDRLTVPSLGQNPGGSPDVAGSSTADSTPWEGDAKDGTAHYNKSETVKITANYDDKITSHDIHAPHVVINGDSFQDITTITKVGDNYTITTTANGKTETFVVDGNVAKDITLNGSNIKFVPDTLKTDPKIKTPNASQSGSDPKIITDKSQLPLELQNLMNLIPSLTVTQLLDKLKSKYPNLDTDKDGKLSAAELKAGVTNQVFPPIKPNTDFLNFMLDIDPKMKDSLDTAKQSGGGDVYVNNMRDATNRLIDLLKTLYPGIAVSRDPKQPADISAATPNWVWANNIVFNGHQYAPFGEPGGAEGSIGEVLSKWIS